VGVGGCLPSKQNLSLFTLTAALPFAPLHSAAKIAAFFQLRDGVIGHRVTFLFSQPLLQATYDLSGAPQCEGNRVPKDFSLRHSLNRT
jgi:hypothetical protein